MDFIAAFLERLPAATPAELANLRVEYEDYLAGLNSTARVQAIERVEPVLTLLAQEAVARMDAAMATYQLRHNLSVPA